MIGSVEIDGAVKQMFHLVEEILHDLFEPSVKTSFPRERIIRVILENGPTTAKSLAYFDELIGSSAEGLEAERWVRCSQCINIGQEGYISGQSFFEPEHKLCQPFKQHYDITATYKEFRNQNADFRLALSYQLVGKIHVFSRLQDEIMKSLKLKEKSSERRRKVEVLAAFIVSSTSGPETTLCLRYFLSSPGLTCITEIQGSDDETVVDAADSLDQVMEDFVRENKAYVKRGIIVDHRTDFQFSNIDDLTVNEDLHVEPSERLLHDLKKRGNFKNFGIFEITDEESVLLDQAVKIRCRGRNESLKVRIRTLRHNDFTSFAEYTQENGMVNFRIPFFPIIISFSVLNWNSF